MRRIALVGLIALEAAACRRQVDREPRPYVQVDEGGEPFRSDFNAHAEELRVVMLVSPT